MRDQTGFIEEKKAGLGCVAKGCIALVVGGVLTAILGVVIGWYVLFHTAVPARTIAAIINQNPNIQIEGITGSISSGFAVETVRIKDSDGNTNALDDIRLKYEKEGDTIVITEVHVGRGYFYVDRAKGKTTFEPDSKNTSASPPKGSSNGDKLKILIKTISINDITIEDKTTGEKFKLDGIQVENLMLGDDFSMGKLVVECSACDLYVTPSDGADSGKMFDVKGVIKPAIHENLIASIDIKGAIDASVKDQTAYDLSAFGGKVTYKGGDDDHTVAITDLELSKFFKDVPPIANLNLKVAGNNTESTVNGSFKIGTHTFTIDQVVKEPKDAKAKDDTPITATCKVGSTTHTISVSSKDFDKKLFPKMALLSTPDMLVSEAMASLLTGKALANLTPEEKQTVEKASGYFKKSDAPTKTPLTKPTPTPAPSKEDAPK